MQLSVRDVSVFLAVPTETVYRWVGQDGIPYHKINDDIRFNRAELLEWAMAREVPVSPDLIRAGEAARVPFPGLLEALKASGVAHGVGGADQAAVLRAVAERVELPEGMRRESFCQMLSARENLGFVGVGDGVAVPHARCPVALPVSKPSATLCFLEDAVDFRAVDGKPVRALFVFVCPSVRTHLHLLARLVAVLRVPAFRAALARQAPAAELLAALAEAEAGSR